MSSPPSPERVEGRGSNPAPPTPDPRPSTRSALIGRSVLGSLVSSAGAVAVALLLGAVVIVLSGDDPVAAYRALVRGAFGDLSGLSETLVSAAPLILAGLWF